MEKIETIRIGDKDGLNLLRENGEAYMKPSGGSMKPIINSKDKILLKATKDQKLEQSIGDVVYCKVKGRYYVHLVKSKRKNKGRWEYQIGNNKGGINGWTSEENIFAVVSSVNGELL